MTPEHKALVDALTRKAETDGLLSVEDIRSVAESLPVQPAQPQAGEAVGAFEYCDGCSGYECGPTKGCAYPDVSPQPANPAQVTDALKSAEKALRPVYDAVFNDNGDITVDGPHDYDEAVAGYFAYKKIERALAAIGAGGQAVAGIGAGGRESPLEWAVEKWHHEVANRPLKNVHRAALDTAWRQVIRHFGGNPDALCGPDHYTMIGQNPEGFALSQPHPADERVVEALRSIAVGRMTASDAAYVAHTALAAGKE